MSSETLTRPDVAPPRTRRQLRDRFRGDIEGLRAVAVVLVVAFHAGVGLVGGGFVGVDVFFVLSGFLITGLLVDEISRTGTISLGDFYARRVRRLLPLATLVLAATAAATYALIPPIDRKGVAADIVGSALWSANWRFAAESTQYMADTDKSPVLHYWSLAVEEQFYVVWPLLLLLLVGGTGLALRAWPVAFRRIALALGVVIAGSLWLSWTQTDATSTFAYFGLHTRAWELGVGAALALVRPMLPLLTRRAAEGGGTRRRGHGARVGRGDGRVHTVPRHRGTRAGARHGPARRRGRPAARRAGLQHAVPPRARYVGRISYAWYLWHWPVLVLATARGVRSTMADDGAASTHASWSVVTLAVALSFVLAAVSHHLVEQPLRQAGFLKVSRRRSLVAGGVLVATSLVASLALVVSTTAAGEQGAVAAPPSEPAVRQRRREDESSSGELRAAAPEGRPGRTARAEHAGGGAREQASRGRAVLRGIQADLGPAARGLQGRPGAGGGADHRAHRGLARHCVVPRASGRRPRSAAGPSTSSARVPARWSTSTVRQAGATSPYDACTTWRAHLLDRLETIEGLDAVVIGRWMAYRNVDRASPTDRPAPRRPSEPCGEAGAERTFDRLRRVDAAHRRHGGRAVADRRRAVVPLGAPPGRREVRLLPRRAAPAWMRHW